MNSWTSVQFVDYSLIREIQARIPTGKAEGADAE